jgi:hypothetical protein
MGAERGVREIGRNYSIDIIALTWLCPLTFQVDASASVSIITSTLSIYMQKNIQHAAITKSQHFFLGAQPEPFP